MARCLLIAWAILPVIGVRLQFSPGTLNGFSKLPHDIRNSYRKAAAEYLFSHFHADYQYFSVSFNLYVQR